MDRSQRPPLRHPPEQAHDLPRLAQVEAVEWLVHDEQRLRRQQADSQQQAAPVTLGERANGLRQHRPERQGADGIPP